MLKTFKIGVGALALAATVAAGGVACAADLSVPAASVQAPTTASGFDWNGFYAGVHTGYASGSVTGDADFLDSLTGGILGVQAGYNFQNDPWLAGFETDFSYSGLKDSAGGQSFSQKWLGTTTARIGFTYDKWLFYGKGGVAYGDVKASTPASGSDDAWALGWTAGAGIEYGFTPKMTGRIEYQHVDLGKKTLLPGTPDANSSGAATDAVKAALNYKF